MRNRAFVLTLAVTLLLPQAYAVAQTATSSPTSNPSSPKMTAAVPPEGPRRHHSPAPSSGTGEFEQLSPGGQKIARALYEAQVRRGDHSGGTTPQRLTLDEIAQRKQDGQGWGQVFKGMKSEGLVRQKNLGQVVSSYNHRHHHRHDQGHHGHHARKHHDGDHRDGHDRHEGYRHRDGHDRHEGYNHREGHRTYSRDGRGHEGRGYEGRRYEGRGYQGSGGSSGEQGSRVGASSSRPTYTAARSNDGGRGSQAGSTPRQGGGSGNGHSK